MKTCFETVRLAGLLACLTPVAAAVAQTAVSAAVADAVPNTAQAQETVSEDAPRVVITGARMPAPLAETPQRIEVITRKDLQQTPARDMTDLVKKNASADVVQYPGVLGGVGIRGFRPQTGGLNQRTLLLVNGLPAMTDNFAMLPQQDVQRVELLKGPASALYGAQAMAGVVNVITRESKGALRGGLGLGAGSFAGRSVQGDIGGRINDQFNFDYSGGWFRQGDYTMAEGGRRPFTGYQTQEHALRLGWDFAPAWSLNLRTNWYKGDDIESPGSIKYKPSYGVKDLERKSAALQIKGQSGQHALSASVFAGQQTQNYYSIGSKTSNPPVLSYADKTRWNGLQLQDAWSWGRHATLTLGVDYERAKVVTQSWMAGLPTSPYNPDNQRTTTGVYLQQSFDFNEGRSNVYAGGRHDNVRLETLATPYNTTSTPGDSRFGQFSPSAGFKHRWKDSGWNMHGTVGRGFVVPDAMQFSGAWSVDTWDGGKEITRGNRALKPETSTTWDFGAGWESDQWMADLTYFDTRVKNKVVVTNGIETAPKVLEKTYINAESARIQGLELSGRWRFYPGWAVSLGATHFLKNEEKLASGWYPTQNVPDTTVRMALTGQYGPLSGRLGVRYVSSMVERPYGVNPPRSDQYPGFTVWDLSARYQLARQHAITLSVDNLSNKHYQEKPGYPQPGRSYRLGYRWDFL